MFLIYTIEGDSCTLFCVSNTAVDCNTLPDPLNGVVVHDSGTGFQAQAIYRCDNGFTVVEGDSVRLCNSNGEWSGREAVCGRKYYNLCITLTSLSIVIGISKSSMLDKNVTQMSKDRNFS